MASRSLRFLLRWPRFSLRSLLIAVTLLCLVLGGVFVPVHRRLNAIARIRQDGGEVQFDEQASCRYAWVPDSIKQRIGWEFFWQTIQLEVKSRDGLNVLDQFPEATHISLDIKNFTDDELARAADKLTRFTYLNIMSNELTDQSYDVLSQLQNLKKIGTGYNTMSNEMLERLRDGNSALKFRDFTLCWSVPYNPYMGSEPIAQGILRGPVAARVVLARITDSVSCDQHERGQLEFETLETLLDDAPASHSRCERVAVEPGAYAAPRGDCSLPAAGTLAIIALESEDQSQWVVPKYGSGRSGLHEGITRLRDINDPELAAAKHRVTEFQQSQQQLAEWLKQQHEPPRDD